MAMFHSTISRRDFMKMMAAATGGIGAAAAIAPAFHDVDELLASPTAVQKRPWYVKERDFYNPTTEVDWDVIKRRDPDHTGQETIMWAKYYGQARADAAAAKGAENVKKWEAENAPGFTYRSRALKSTVTRGWPAYVSLGWGGPVTNASWKGTVYAGVQTPSQRGEPKWTGTPEEASRMLNAFMRYTGNAIAGYGPLDSASRERKQVISTKVKNSSPIKIVFEDVDAPYEEKNVKRVIPNKHTSYIVHWEMMSHELARTTKAWGGLFNGSDHVATILKPSTFNFLRYLGYQMAGTGGDDGTPFVEGASANLSGVAESSRNNVYCLTPEYGAIGRIHNYTTDLPLAATKPIDAGLFRFCHSCHKCADNCPSQAISQDKDSSWEIPPIQGQPNIMHNPGTKEFWGNGALCRMWRTEYGTSCNQCWGECTFTTNNESMIHNVIKGMIPTVSVFNGFFYKMGEAFGYGPDDEKAELWWDRSFPIFGFDSTRVAYDGGYQK